MSTAALPNAERGRETEPERVIQWRLAQLRAAGYTQQEAAALAARLDIDVYGATDLLRRGCPSQTALRILL
jgi:hypothetical protein